MRRVILSMVLLLLLAPISRASDSITLSKPVYTEVYLRANQTQKISGNVLRYDDDMFVVKAPGGEQELRWVDLTGSSAFALRARLIDRHKPDDWLKVGKMAWSMNATDQAQRAFDFAIKLDPDARSRVKEIKSQPPGSALKAATEPTATTESVTTSSDASTTPDGVVKYLKSTPAQDAAEIAQAQKFAKSVADDMKLQFTELQTSHFIIFTDWDPQEFNFLQTNVEAAYAAVSKQFGIPVKENVFVGKLPVFMFAKHEDFKTFAQTYDEIPVTDTMQGYHQSRRDGTAHMVMWKPDLVQNNGDVHKAEVTWARVLTHEFTHAFVGRYRTNVRIPHWLNEGLAEVISHSVFPEPEAKQYARRFSTANRQLLDPIFDDDQLPAGQFYPVMETMVQMLIDRDRTRFIKMFDAIKDGQKTEDALKTYYGVDYDGLVSAWREYIVRH